MVLYSTQDPEASAVVVEDGTIVWIGPEDSAAVLFPEVPRVEATGSLVTPGFVDACAGTAGGVTTEDPTPEDARLGIIARLPWEPGTHEGMRVVAPLQGEPVPYLDLAGQGVPIALGSGGDLARSPWEWVRAVAHEGDPDQRLSDRAAFLAASRAGQRLRGRAHPGSLLPGVEATFVVWEPWDLTVRGQDERIQTWSTDPRSRTPMLPDLTEGAPAALRTVVRGRVVHDLLGSDAQPESTGGPDATTPGQRG
ncbi:hypothetical protein JSY14_00970 [Brachybacterium sp. EF45031]|nr:hypothetical protein [Brachybacterium sillae]